jgi:heme-degrading monooxygenase HmoA
MIKRLWHGYTTVENADTYETLLQEKIFKGISNRIPGLLDFEILRRELDGEVEFLTILTFDSLDAVKIFAADDYETAVVPPSARGLLKRFDSHCQHYEVVPKRN